MDNLLSVWHTSRIQDEGVSMYSTYYWLFGSNYGSAKLRPRIHKDEYRVRLVVL